MPEPGRRPPDSEFSFAGEEPTDPATGRPLPVRQGGRYRGKSPRSGKPDGCADTGRMIRR